MTELRITTRYGPCLEEVLYPHTPVFFPDGVPAELREEARGDLGKALQLLAQAVRYWRADPADVFESLPEWGGVVTAADLAAS